MEGLGVLHLITPTERDYTFVQEVQSLKGFRGREGEEEVGVPLM